MKNNGNFWKVLLAEEDDRLRSRCRHELKRRGYTTIETSTGSETLDRITRERFDLVVLEVDLTDMDGMTIYLNAAKANPKIRKEHFLFTTSSEKLIYSLSRTTLNYRKKPYHPHELADQVDLLLRGYATGRGRKGALPAGAADRRVENRLPWSESCRLAPSTDGDSVPVGSASTEDISGRGLRIRYSGCSPITPGSNVVVEIKSLKIKAPARVVWSTGPAGGEACSGLRVFNDFNPSSLTTVLTGNQSHRPF